MTNEFLTNNKDKQVINKFNSNFVIFDNKLSRSGWDMTANEQHVIYLVISLIKPFEPNSNYFRISKKAFIKKLGVNPAHGYQMYKTIINQLMGKLNIFLDPGNSNTALAFIIHSDWEDKTSYFDIAINEIIMPLLDQLTDKQYTINDLKTFQKLKPKHSMSLYRNCISWTDKKLGHKYIIRNTQQLKNMFAVCKKEYLYKNGKFNRTAFEKQAIKKPIEELNKKSPLYITWSKKKTRNLDFVYRFDFEEKKSIGKKIGSNSDSFTDDVIHEFLKT